MPRQPLDYYVLDAISFEAEQFDDILKFLNEPESEWLYRYERTLQSIEVQGALMRLVKDGAVAVKVVDDQGAFVDCGEGVWPTRPWADMYFELTGRGDVLYLNWDM